MNEKFLLQAKLVLKTLSFLSSYPQFALKGGTAINFFIRKLPRLSVDIDLTYLPVSERPESLTAISDILINIATDITKRHPDYLVQSKMLDNKISALRISDGNVMIKLEPNLVTRGSVFNASILTISERAEHELDVFVTAQCLSFADLYGGKICAALDRQHPRDLFDVMLLLENEGLTETIRKAFIVYLISHPRPISELLDPNIKDIRPVFENEFQGMTFEPAALQDLIAAREKLMGLIRTDLTEEERKFILSVKTGQPDWNALGIDGISRLPAVRWKLENLKRMDPGKRAIAIDKLKRCLRL